MVEAGRVEVGCPLCAGTEATPWGHENGWTARRCAGCGLVYVSPRPAPEAISEAAQLGQHATDAGVMDVVGRYDQRKVRGFAERLRELWPVDPPWARTVRWLDVGAGFGELVGAVTELAGGSAAASEVLGLEPCEPKVARARALGLRVEARSLASLEPGRWDVVSMVNVVSHLPSPGAFLAEVRALLRPGGELLLVTGNGAEIARADYPQVLSLPDHLLFAGEPQLRRLLTDAGFLVERVLRHATTMPRPHWEARLEGLASRLLRRRVGYAGSPFRSLWLRARRRD